jgi:antirestriction protein ArdC
MAKFDIYEAVTDRIIEQLEQGIIPWHKPWTGIANGAISRSTGRPYSLLNQFLLGKAGEYLTFKQVQEAGGKVRKGEKSSMVVFWKMFPVEETDDKGEKTTKLVPMLRYYNVFHIDQCEGIEPKYKVEELQRNFEPVEEAERICADYLKRSGVTLEHIRGDRAYYSPASDSVVVPLREQFNSVAEYYGTLFHELTHSTGHKSRLDRLTKTAAFGNEDYSKEELVAEIGAASVVNYLGIETASQFKNAAAYIQSWLSALRNDKRMVVSAASRAEKAFNMIVGETAEQRESVGA